MRIFGPSFKRKKKKGIRLTVSRLQIRPQKQERLNAGKKSSPKKRKKEKKKIQAHFTKIVLPILPVS